MNLLAHAFLAGDDPGGVLGNLLADFIRPPDVDRLPPAVRAGVLHHRRIDAFTDRHPVVQRSIARVGPTWGWFSGILIDVYYDHILALTWDRYAEVPLRVFVDWVHRLIAEVPAEVIPEPARGYARKLVETDRLMSYAAPDGSGIAEAYRRLSDRIAERMPNRAVRLEAAMPELRAAHADLADEFHEFFPELRRFANPG